MDINLFSLFDEELFNEAKRLVPIVYNEESFFSYDEKKFKKNLKKKYKAFYISIKLFLIGLCNMKEKNEDWKNDKLDIKKRVKHHKEVLEYDKITFNANIEETIDEVAKDIINNYNNYKNKSLFEIMPTLVSKYMKTHNDSVEHQAYVLYLNKALKKYGKSLTTTNLRDLQDI